MADLPGAVPGSASAHPTSDAPATPATRRLLERLPGSIQARSTAVAVLVVGVTMALGALGLLSVLQSALREGVEQTDEAQLADVASLLRAGPLPAALPAGRGDTFTQVVVGGRVVSSSPTVVPGRPITARPTGEEGLEIRSLPEEVSADDGPGHPEDDGPWLVETRAVPVGTDSAVATVEVAGSLRSVAVAGQAVAVALTAGLPVLVVIVGLLVWWLTGRALHPVEALRREVADITLRDLDRRVPVPGSADEIQRLALTMNGMLDRLESSSAAQRRFVSDASHELRNPVAALQANLEVAVALPQGPQQAAALADALDEGRRLQALVEDLLVVARAEQPGPSPRRELVDLDEVVFAEAERLSAPPAIDLHRVSGGRVLGDAGQLTRVVRNVLDNARRHARGSVAVELADRDGTVVLAVIDDGPGIPPAERERVFERFARLDEGRARDGGGAGLGLAIVREIVAAHGGTVRATQGDLGGARVEIHLPGADEEE